VSETIAPGALARGDRVERVSIPKGRVGRLRVGLRGTIVVAPEENEFHWASVCFGKSPHAHLLAIRHLCLIQRASTEEG
jgi:hypothetical protein